MDDLFVVVTPGLETIAAKEMHDMGIGTFTVENGGIALQGDMKDIYKMNLHLRTPSRILIRLGHFHSSSFSELEKKSRRLPWEVYLSAGQPFSCCYPTCCWSHRKSSWLCSKPSKNQEYRRCKPAPTHNRSFIE
jgi:23S rRNA G2445 N2-methylase RlmL